MMEKIDALLDSIGVKDDLSRAVLAQSIMNEMSVSVPTYLSGGGRTHGKEQCKATRKAGGPKGCVLHRPTIHQLTGSPQIMRATTLIEDMCSHGVGHPNPDSAAFLNWRDGHTQWNVHGCDGCCGPLPKPEEDYLDRDGEW